MQNDFIFPCANLEEVEGGGVSGLKKLKRNIKHTDSKITKSSNSSTPPPPCKQVCSSTNDHWTELYRKEFI